MNQLSKLKSASELAIEHLKLAQYTEIQELGHKMANLLYFGDEWAEIGECGNFETVNAQFMAIFLPLFEELPSTLYVDRDCEYVTDKEPEFDSTYYETEDDGYKECCCDHSRQSYLDDMADMFYHHWKQIRRKEYLTEWLGKYCVEAISYSTYI